MILGIEIAMTVFGLLMLITGKTFGKNSFAHPHLRFLGAFMLTLLPVAIVSVLLFGVVWAMMHPNQTMQELEQSMRWPATGVEAGIAVLYVIIAILWEKSIRGKATTRDAVSLR